MYVHTEKVKNVGKICVCMTRFSIIKDNFCNELKFFAKLFNFFLKN